jgi:hypothetical protein
MSRFMELDLGAAMTADGALALLDLLNEIHADVRDQLSRVKTPIARARVIKMARARLLSEIELIQLRPTYPRIKN